MKKFISQLSIFCLLITSTTSCTGKKSYRMPQSGEDPWTSWSRDKGSIGGLLVLSRIREELLTNNLHDPHISYKGYTSVECTEATDVYRTADGSCYHRETPHVGAANTAFGRNIPPQFIDFDAKEKLMTPNPSLVSKTFFTRDEFKPVPFLNMLAASWIQFMNHDWLSHGRNNEKKRTTVKGHDRPDEVVEMTRENPTSADNYDKEFSKVSANTVTHWWDGSQLYGSSKEVQDQVRSFSKGKMKMVNYKGKELLPKDMSINPKYNKQNIGHELTGFRDNWWVGLSMLHHLFVKEHNAIAEMLYEKHVKGKDEASGKWRWRAKEGHHRIGKKRRIFKKDTILFDDKELDEHIFQVARLINAAVMSKIHTIEWTPAILNNKTLRKGMYTNWYGVANPQTWSKLIKHIPGFNKTDWFSGTKSGYVIGGIVGDKINNYGVPFSITEEFTSVYRLHSLLPEALDIKRVANKSKVTQVPMADTRNEKSYGMMEEYGLDDLFYSFGTQLPGQLVLNNFPKFMQNLEIPGHGTMDLAMIDVFRDRERGVPRYNQFRRAIGLKPIAKYSDFFMDGEIKTERQKQIIEKFNAVYGKDANGDDNVEMIDLLVGTSAEEVRPEGFGFGETMFQIFILMASRRLMADPYYTTKYNVHYYTKAGMKWIDNEGYFHKVIARHMPHLKKKFKGLRTAFEPWHE